MAKRESVRSFYVIVVDQDSKEFSVEGPTTDETKWYKARKRAETKGRDIDVYPLDLSEGHGGDLPGRESVVQDFGRQAHLSHLKHVEPGVILGKHMFL